MKSAHRLFAIAAAALSLAALPAAPAFAQRVFVAAQGSDANPCSFALPCRTFQHAHDVVAAGGEIDVLDPAGYGALTITKAISIQGHGFSGVSVASGANTIGIQINAGANDAVNLNGLLIEGSGVGAIGIRFFAGKSLVVENCVARNTTNAGLWFSSNTSTLQTLSVSDSVFTANGTVGIQVQTFGTGAVTASIDRAVLDGNGTGLLVSGINGTGALGVAVTDTISTNNTFDGFAVQTTSGHSDSSLSLTRVTAAGNLNGLETTAANAIIRVSQSTLTGNTTGYFNNGGAGSIQSYGDNYIDGNGGNTGSLTAATKQ
jgi:hypothetical protein